MRIKNENLLAGQLPGWFSPARPDLLTNRPYFLVPFGLAGGTEDRGEMTSGIIAAMRATDATDLFVISHGWHRNLCSGVSAYDRLIARFAALKARGRLDGDSDRRPMFVCVHWNSDPEKDGWVDRSGRRDKQSFLDNVAKAFVPNMAGVPDAGQVTENFESKAAKFHANSGVSIGPDNVAQAMMLNDMEDIFEAMSRTSAPDTPDEYDPTTWEPLLGLLDRYELNGFAEPATRPEKAASVWRCYFEATNKAFLTDQTIKPIPVGWTVPAFNLLLKYVIGIAGIAALIGGLPKVVECALNIPWQAMANEIVHPDAWSHGLALPPYDGETWGRLGIALAGCFALFLLLQCRSKPAKGSMMQTIAWAPVQIVATAPALIYLLLTYLFRSGLAVVCLAALFLGWYGLGAAGFVVLALASFVASKAGTPLNGVFRERLKTPDDRSFSVREVFVAPARWVVAGFLRILPADSNMYRVAMTLDNQLAFFEMQRRGTGAGCELGLWLHELSDQVAGNKQKVRVHLLGHSFGGLVITNALRTWAAKRLESRAQIEPKGFFLRSRQSQHAVEPAQNGLGVHSFCVVQGAIASDWFSYEQTALSMVEGSVSSTFSAYDTATGLLYSLANNCQSGMGSVGSCNLGAPFRQALTIGQGGDFALLVEPPSIAAEIKRALQVTPPPIEDPAAPRPLPTLLNLDVSRICYEGPVATGGGHDDIFKDDLVNLLWSVCTYAP